MQQQLLNAAQQKGPPAYQEMIKNYYICLKTKPFLILAGMSGIGKTQIALRFAELAAGQGVQLLWGRCYERDAAPPYGPWIEALSALAAATEPDRLGRLLGAGAPPLARLVPAIQAALPNLPPVAALGPEEERLRLYDAATRLLLAVAVERPTVLVIDDLHWVDRDSLGLLRHFGRFLGRARLLIVATYRDVEVGRTHPLDDALAALRREVEYRRIAVPGLGVDDVAAYLATTAGEELPTALVRAVHAETGGSPFYVREVFRHLVEEQKIISG